MGRSPEVMIINGDRAFSWGRGRDFYHYPDGMKGCVIESERHGVIEICQFGRLTTIVKDVSALNFGEILIDLPPQNDFSRS